MTKQHRPLLAWTLIAALGCALALLVPTYALAHAEYARSIPGAGARVPTAERLDVWFTQPLFRRVGGNTLAVTTAAGQRVEAGEAAIDAIDRNHLSVALAPNLPAGVYTVAWTSLSADDGDPASGSFTFTIDPTAPAAGATPPPSASAVAPGGSRGTASTASPGTAFPIWTVSATILFAIAMGLGWWAVRPETRA